MKNEHINALRKFHNEENDRKYALAKEKFRAQLKWTSFDDSELKVTTSINVQDEPKTKKSKVVILGEASPEWKSREDLSAGLEGILEQAGLEKNPDEKLFEELKESRKFLKKPRFELFKVNLHRVDPAVYFGKPIVVPIGDAQLEPNYMTGGGY